MQASKHKTTSSLSIDRKSSHSCDCKWEIPNYQELKSKCISSPHFEVGGFAFFFSMYPKGDHPNLSDHFTLCTHINNPQGSKFDCFASFMLKIVNQVQESKSLCEEYCFRFSCKYDSFDWSESRYYKTILDPKSGFLSNGSLLISVDICVLDETIMFSRDDEEEEPTSLVSGSFVSNGKFTWTIKNYSLFINTMKIISPGFHVGDSSLQLSLETSVVNGVKYLALFLEIKDTEKAKKRDQSCWFRFQISVLNQKQGPMYRDSYGRFDLGDDKRLGWNDFMIMSDFIGLDKGFLVDDTVKLSVSFNAIKDSCSFREIVPGWKSRGLMSRKSVWANKYMGRFEWRIEKFTRLKDQLKKKKIKGLCVRSKRFQIGNQDFRLLVYPRGQSQKPFHLSMFLEVLDAQNTSGDRNCFVNYRLSVVNQKNEGKSVTKESQNRSSKAAEDWGWSEFMTLASLFDQDSGYILKETAVFAAEVRILKDKFEMKDISELREEFEMQYISELRDKFEMQDISGLRDKDIHIDRDGTRKIITWKMENFLSFKEIMATQRIFSESFKVGGCELRIGVYVSVDTIYAYLECDPSVVIGPDKQFWVSYKMGVLNQDREKHFWKKSSLCTKTSMNSDLQFMKLSDMLEANSGFVFHEMVMFACEILDISSEQEVLAEVSTPFHGLIDSETGDVVTRNRVDSRVHESSPILENLMEAVNFLQHKVDDLVLDATVECCQRLKPSTETSGAVCQSEPPQEVSPEDSSRSLIYERLDTGFDNSTGTCAVECSDAKAIDIPDKAIFGQSVFPPEASAGVHQDFRPTGSFKTKFPVTPVKILGFIVNLLRALSGPVSQGHPEPRQGLHSAELVKLLPKLVNACFLLDQIPRPDAEPALLPPMLTVISQLHFSSEVWESVLSQAFDILGLSNDEALGATIRFLFKAASQCQRIPQAVRAVRGRLERLGAKVSPFVLDLLSNTMNSWGEVAEAMLREIDSVFALDEKCLQNLDGSSLYGENGLATRSLNSVDELLLSTDRHFSDIFILIDMLAIPSLAVEASQVFERGVARGSIVDHSVAMVLGRCLPQIGESVSSAEKCEHQVIARKGNISSLCIEEVFTLFLGLAETLSISGESRVHQFVRMFYALLFTLFAHESYQNRMLKGLVVRATSPSENCSEFYLDILVFLIHWGGGVAKSVLGMILKNAAELTNADRDALQDRLCASEGEIIRKQAEISNLVSSKAVLSDKLIESKAAFEGYKSEMRLEVDRFAQEKNELSKQIQAAERQFKQLCSERDEETRKLSKEKKKAVEEKNVLSKKLKTAEAEREIFDKELNRYRTEVVAQGEGKQSLLDEVQKLKQEVEQIEVEKQEKEEEITRYKNYTKMLEATSLESKNACQKAVEEKNVLSKKLKTAEAEREIFYKEMNIYRTEVVAQGEGKQSLLDEVQKLQREVEQIEVENRKKEEEIRYYKHHINMLEAASLESEIAHQQHIQSLQVSLEKEKLKIAPQRVSRIHEDGLIRALQHQQFIQSLEDPPPYGAGLEHGSVQEFETPSRIHEYNRHIQALQLQASLPSRQSPSSSNTLQSFDRMHPTAPPPYGAGLEHGSMQELETPSGIREYNRHIHALQHQASLPSRQSPSSSNTLQNFDRMHPTAPPPYGAGLELGLMQELETPSGIHEYNRHIHALQHQASLPSRQSPSSSNTLQNFDGMHPTAPPPMAGGPSTSYIPNSAQLNRNRLNDGTAAPRFNNRRHYF